ncbi:protein RER1C-like isoform X2 [Typha latifolia]|uniref:protein RER1C-like isoform X2 n=1 Tax=Typha latifolia TaxID=4733 RepID=UPI003C2E488E
MMDSSAGDPPTGGVPEAISSWISPLTQRYQHLLDKATPHVLRRWLGFAAVAIIYAIRVWFAEGFYIVSYALGIYVLNIFIAFLSPQVDPEIHDALDADGGAVLPTRSSDEFRPFVRRLPEFKFWFMIGLPGRSCRSEKTLALKAFYPFHVWLSCVVVRDNVMELISGAIARLFMC